MGLSAHIAPSREKPHGRQGQDIVFPIVITAVIVFIVSGVVTFFNIGLRADFLVRWWSAFAVGWPVEAVTAYLTIPFARGVTQRIVALIERTA